MPFAPLQVPAVPCDQFGPMKCVVRVLARQRQQKSILYSLSLLASEIMVVFQMVRLQDGSFCPPGSLSESVEQNCLPTGWDIAHEQGINFCCVQPLSPRVGCYCSNTWNALTN